MSSRTTPRSAVTPSADTRSRDATGTQRIDTVESACTELRIRPPLVTTKPRTDAENEILEFDSTLESETSVPRGAPFHLAFASRIEPANEEAEALEDDDAPTSRWRLIKAKTEDV